MQTRLRKQVQIKKKDVIEDPFLSRRRCHDQSSPVMDVNINLMLPRRIRNSAEEDLGGTIFHCRRRGIGRKGKASGTVNWGQYDIADKNGRESEAVQEGGIITRTITGGGKHGVEKSRFSHTETGGGDRRESRSHEQGRIESVVSLVD